MLVVLHQADHFRATPQPSAQPNGGRGENLLGVGLRAADEHRALLDDPGQVEFEDRGEMEAHRPAGVAGRGVPARLRRLQQPTTVEGLRGARVRRARLGDPVRLGSFSRMVTSMPSRASSRATRVPTGPPPTTATPVSTLPPAGG
ncbi:hypothetical protein Q3W71_01115 [Micromonospora sp. C28SCA-DRY-2]|nr:hypothetical protein [Micromonospora sp. C28SCA-DRY-2]MDO3700281.1 hypothetical protein [Micromonospora sp. C28SCA-DRY-2]